jgi:hypothetical protein
LKESLSKTLYDLVRAEQFVPFSMVFATGQRFEIKTRDHISLGPVNRSDVGGLKTLIVWNEKASGEPFTCGQSLKLNDRNLKRSRSFRSAERASLSWSHLIAHRQSMVNGPVKLELAMSASLSSTRFTIAMAPYTAPFRSSFGKWI